MSIFSEANGLAASHWAFFALSFFHNPCTGSSQCSDLCGCLCHPSTVTDMILFWCVTGAGKGRRRAKRQAGKQGRCFIMTGPGSAMG